MRNVRVALGLVLTVAAGCKQMKQSSTKDIIAGTTDRGLELATGFNSANNLVGLARCVDPTDAGDLADTAPLVGGSQSSFTMDQNSSYQDVLAALTGDVNASTKVNQTGDANGAVKMALNHSADETSKKWTWWWKGETGFRQFRSQLKINTLGQKAKTDGNLKRTCGDSYVDKIVYGASFMATLRIDFGNVQDKNSFGANLNLDSTPVDPKDPKNTQVKVGLNIQGDRTKISKNLNVSFIVDSIGGSSTGLLGVPTSSLITCGIDKISDCTDAMNKEIEYASTTFKADLEKSISNWVPVQFITKGYAAAGVNDLVGQAPDPSDISDLNYMELEYGEKYAALNQLQQRATRIQNSVGKLGLSDDQIAKIAQFFQDNAHNIAVYDELIKFCHDGGTAKGCQDHWDNKVMGNPPRLRTTDPTVLIKLTNGDPAQTLLTSDLYGGFGGSNAFNNAAQIVPTDVVQNVSIYSSGPSGWADGLSLQMRDTSKLFRMGGLNTQQVRSMDLDPDETLVQVDFSLSSPDNASERISYIYLRTSKNKSIDFGTKTKNLYSFTVPDGGHILGFYGRQGDQIDRIGSIYVAR